MHRILLALLLFASPAFAQFTGSQPAASTALPPICGPVTGTLSAQGAVVSLPASCAGYGSYVFTITRAAGDTAFAGSISSSDVVTGGQRRLLKTGSEATEVATEILDGTQPDSLEYRTCPGAGPLVLTASAYTSGKATITVWGIVPVTACFINGSAQTPEEASIRGNKAFSVFTGNQVVTATQYMSLLFVNPAGSNTRAFITYRGLQCDNPTTVVASKWWGIRAPTVNNPTTPLTISGRGNTGNATPSAMTVTYTASATTFPDTATSTPLTSRPGGIIPSGGNAGGPLHRQRTVEPGQSTALTLLAVAQPSGLGVTNPTCQIEMDWYEGPKQ